MFKAIVQLNTKMIPYEVFYLIKKLLFCIVIKDLGVLNIFTQFFLFVITIGVVIYMIPAGLFHLLYHKKEKFSQIKIQPKTASNEDIKREILLSCSSILIFAIGATITLQFVLKGYSLLYYNWSEYPFYYHILSFFFCLLLHDTYFYWSHRFMHWKPIFKYFHKGHHRSMVPTAWASLAFQPLEAIVQLGTFILIIFVIPLHPIVFGIYIIYDTIVNTAGHNGYELVPKWFSKAPILKYGNTVGHHEYHHIDFKSNFGAFYNIWDRIMGTFKEDLPQK